jgi:hypothetical protein
MIEKDLSEDSETWCVKRRIRIPAMPHPADGITVERALADIEGVLRASVDCLLTWGLHRIGCCYQPYIHDPDRIASLIR